MRPSRALPLTFAVLLLASSLTPSPVAPQDAALAAGVRQVEEGDFEGAILTLEPVVARLALAGGRDAAQACLSLGIARLALGERAAALARFGEALGHEPLLRLSPERYSPKVLAAFEEARRQREAAARTVAPAGSTTTAAKKGRAGRTVLIAGGAVAAGAGLALALGGNDATPAGGEVTFTGARFGTLALDCPNGATGTPLAVAIDLDAQNGTGRDVTIGAVSAVLIIVGSPVVPSEVGFASSAPATVVPATLHAGTTALRVQTTLTCANGASDASRYNEWKGRVTLTVGNAQTVETADTLRINLP